MDEPIFDVTGRLLRRGFRGRRFSGKIQQPGVVRMDLGSRELYHRQLRKLFCIRRFVFCITVDCHPGGKIMVNCPQCDAVLDVEEEDLDEGDVLSCDECGASLTVASTTPLEIKSADADDDDDEDEDDFEDFEEDEEEEEEDEEWE